MKTYPILLLFITAIAHAAPELVGILTTEKDGSLFAIATSPSSPSRWTKIGSTIEGYSVVEYHAKEEILILKKDGLPVALRLKAAKTVDSGKTPSALAELPVEGKKITDAAQDRLAKLVEEREKAKAALAATQRPNPDSSKK